MQNQKKRTNENRFKSIEKGNQKSKNAASLSLLLSSSSIAPACISRLPRLCIVGLSACLGLGRGPTPGDVGEEADDGSSIPGLAMVLATAVSTTRVFGRSPSLLDMVPVTERRRLPMDLEGLATGGGLLLAALLPNNPDFFLARV